MLRSSISAKDFSRVLCRALNHDTERCLAEMPLSPSVLLAISRVITWAVHNARYSGNTDSRQEPRKISHELLVIVGAALEPAEIVRAVSDLHRVKWIGNPPATAELLSQQPQTLAGPQVVRGQGTVGPSP